MLKKIDSEVELVVLGKQLSHILKRMQNSQVDGGGPNIQQLNELTASFNLYQQRIELLTEQLFQCEALTRFIPMWLAVEERFDKIQADIGPAETEILDRDLRNFISQSVYDHF